MTLLAEIVPPAEQPTPFRFSVDAFLGLCESGYFEGGRVELIEGEIIRMPAQKNDHAFAVTMALRALEAAFPAALFWVRPQFSLRLGRSVPDPDVAVTRGPAAPGAAIPAEALLVVEISDTTIAYDLRVKSTIYAAGGVGDYWVLNLPERRLVVHREPIADDRSPTGWRYGDVRTLAPGEAIAMSEKEIDFAGWLP